MDCPDCGFETQPGFAFCPKCGRKLPVTCPSCGSGCAPDFAFCPRCSHRLEAEVSPPAAPARAAVVPPPAAAPASRHEDAERRTVTLLFADLAGFTSLSERVDPEDVRTFQTELLHELSSAVRRFGGFVEKFVGDAVMAAFGAPVAHEDDPERAVRAAQTMHARMEVLGRRWERRFGGPLALHIGVNTGPVVAGTLGASVDAAYAVTGDTVNTAARLQGAAGPGETLVSDATRRLTEHVFVLEPLGELTVKGKTLAVRAYRVVGSRTTPASARGLDALGLRSALVGRAAELEQVLDAFDRMGRGQAQVVSLVGDAGVGKSRLLQELLAALERDARLEAATLRRAACSSLGEQSYGVVAAFLREAFGIGPGDAFGAARDKLTRGAEGLGAGAIESSQLARVLGYVLGFASEGTLDEVEPEQVKKQIFLAVRALIERRLGEGPLVLVVEDLHWADAASAEILRFMADRFVDRPLLLLFTYRPTLDAGVLATQRALHTVIRLGPLSREESGAILAGLFGPSLGGFPPALRSLIVERAGGHPLYLEEIVRSLVAGGVLLRAGEGWVCPAGGAVTFDVPATIQGMLLAHLDALPPAARRLVQEASVIGPAFDLDLLRQVCGSPEALETSLDLLVEADLIAEVAQEDPTAAAPHRYRFLRALVQEVAYESLLVRRRAELHGRVARALEAAVTEGRLPERLEELALLGHHLVLSADRARGARYLIAAGDRAHAVHANDDAVRYYARALATLETCEDGDADRLLARERLADLLGPMGRREDARRHYDAVTQAAAQAGDPVTRARVHRKVARLHWDAGDRKQALADLQAGLALLDGRRNDLEMAHLCQELGRLAFRNGDNDGAIEWAERALASATRAAEESAATPEAAAAISHGYNTLGIALARTDRMPDAVLHIQRSIAVALEHGLPGAACRGYANLGVLYSTLDPGRAIETCVTGLETAKRIGDLGLQAQLHANLAVAYCNLTNRCEDEGLAAARAAIDIDRQLGQLDHLAVPLIVLGQIHHCRGEPATALAYYREALEVAEAVGEPQLLFPCYDGLATLLLDRGEAAEAEVYLQKAQQVCEQAGVDPDFLAVLPFLS
jgi:predicted ATPase/class 3 adenylate cyclase